jgi:hypothetical protein
MKCKHFTLKNKDVKKVYIFVLALVLFLHSYDGYVNGDVNEEGLKIILFTHFKVIRFNDDDEYFRCEE